jgi:membrane protease YdiL (CAAX protease family)
MNQQPAFDDETARRLRGFGPLGLVSIVVVYLTAPIIGALLVLAWAWASGTPWREIGYVRPKSWIGGLALGVVVGVALKFLMKALVMPLLGADPINQAYHYLAGNRAAIPAMLYAIFVGAGFGEETVFRGFLFERGRKLLGWGRLEKFAIVVLTAVLFGIGHYRGQGLAGAEQGAIVGLVLGGIYAMTGELWMVMCVHVAFDLTAVAFIYWNLETTVARMILG